MRSKIKYSTIALGAVMAMGAMSATAQKKMPQQPKMTDPVVRKIDDSVLVSFRVTTEQYDPNFKYTIKPILYNDQQKELKLESVTLVGKRRNISDMRVGELEGDRRLLNKHTTSVEYKTYVPFEEWMQIVGVKAESNVEGCCSTQGYPNAKLVDDLLLYYNIKPSFAKKKLEYEFTELEKYGLDNPFLHPMEDYDKRYDILKQDRTKGTASVIFELASSTINRHNPANSKALAAILKSFEVIDRDPNAILKYIMVAGYASPEGPLAANTRFAGARAEAVKRFIQNAAKGERIPNELFEVYNGREDWDGLREKVDRSTMIGRSEVLEVIDAYTMEQEIRKTKIKQVLGGNPYRFMLREYYPDLRRGGYIQVFYEINRKATVATAVELEDGRVVWVDPDSPKNIAVTNINKAVDKMVAGEFKAALELLLPFKEDKRSWNHIGVCYMMEHDYTNAKTYLDKAIEAGDKDAEKNLEEIAWALRVVQ